MKAIKVDFYIRFTIFVLEYFVFFFLEDFLNSEIVNLKSCLKIYRTMTIQSILNFKMKKKIFLM